MLPVLKRLDQEPRDELDDERVGVREGAGGEEGRRGHVGESGLFGLSFRRDRLK